MKNTQFISKERLRPAVSLSTTLLLSALLALPTPAISQQNGNAKAAATSNGAANGEQQMITLNLKDADLTALISTVAEVTGRNFIVDPRVKAKVTVISREPMPADELYRVFLSVLQVHGFSAVDSGPVTKIIPDINAKQIAVPTVNGRARAQGDEIVTRVIPAENVPVAQLVPILRPLVPQQGHLAAYPPTNVLIVSDRASNVDRLADIIRRVDQASEDEIEVIPLEFASAPEVVRIVQSLRQATDPNQPPGSAVTMAADERTNSVLLSGDRASRVRIRALIAHLDTPVEAGGDTQVVYLRYAKATELVPVLTGVSENLQQAEAAAQGGGGEGAPRAAAGGQEDISIQAHEATNALVITAPPKMQRSLQTVIRQLDIRRAQILVEAAITEISQNRSKELGVEAGGFDPDGTAPAFGSLFGSLTGGVQDLISLVGGQIAFNPLAAGSGLSLAVGDSGGGYNFGLLLRALASNSNANVLSTPSLVTLDNQEAEIRVAQSVPFVTGQFTNQGQNATNPFQTINREDVGLILKIKPQINEGNSILLDIAQEVSDLGAPTETGDFITNKRSIKTTVLVDDGQLIALGGLISDQVRENESKVPLLGDVPLLGNLFKARAAQKEKRNLMLFLQPSILRDEASASAITSRKYNFMRAQQIRQRERGIPLMPDAVTPVLPKLERPILPPPFETEVDR
jgi:general secretion pathway protein D